MRRTAVRRRAHRGVRRRSCGALPPCAGDGGPRAADGGAAGSFRAEDGERAVGRIRATTVRVFPEVNRACWRPWKVPWTESKTQQTRGHVRKIKGKQICGPDNVENAAAEPALLNALMANPFQPRAVRCRTARAEGSAESAPPCLWAWGPAEAGLTALSVGGLGAMAALGCVTFGRSELPLCLRRGVLTLRSVPAVTGRWLRSPVRSQASLP